MRCSIFIKTGFKSGKKMKYVVSVICGLFMIGLVKANPQQQQAAMAQQMAQQNQQSQQQQQRPLSHQGMQGNVIQSQSPRGDGTQSQQPAQPQGSSNRN